MPTEIARTGAGLLVRPGVDLQAFRPRYTREHPPYRILYASSCYPWKGVFDLLEAFRTVLDRGFSAELVYLFFGEKSAPTTNSAYIRELEQRIVSLGLKDRVVIRDGPLSGIGETIARADILASPLRSGIGTVDIPMSVLEALACGLPVIGTTEGSISEAVVDGLNGYLVEPSAPDALAGAIVKMLGDRTKMKRMGEESYRLAQQFDARNSALVLQKTYSLVVSNGRRVVLAPSGRRWS